MVYLRELRSGDLVVRPLRAGDEPDFVALMTDRAAVRFMFTDDQKTEAGAREFFIEIMESYMKDAQYGVLAMQAADSDEFMGLCGVSGSPAPETLELFCCLAPRYRGRGFATRALELVMRGDRWTVGRKDLLAYVDPANAAGQALAERIGLRRVGRERHPIHGDDCILFSTQLASHGLWRVPSLGDSEVRLNYEWENLLFMDFERAFTRFHGGERVAWEACKEEPEYGPPEVHEGICLVTLYDLLYPGQHPLAEGSVSRIIENMCVARYEDGQFERIDVPPLLQWLPTQRALFENRGLTPVVEIANLEEVMRANRRGAMCLTQYGGSYEQLAETGNFMGVLHRGSYCDCCGFDIVWIEDDLCLFWLRAGSQLYNPEWIRLFPFRLDRTNMPDRFTVDLVPGRTFFSGKSIPFRYWDPEAHRGVDWKFPDVPSVKCTVRDLEADPGLLDRLLEEQRRRLERTDTEEI